MSQARLTLKAFLQRHSVISRVSAEWGHMDAFKHVNNTQYFKYQEVRRLAYFDRLMERVAALDPAGEHFDIAGFHDATGIGPIMSATSCRFKFPVTFPDKLLVGGRVDN